MKKWSLFLAVILLFTLLMGCEVNYQVSETGFKEKDWELVKKSGTNTTVNLMVYKGDQPTIDWLETTVKDEVLALHGIRLNIISATLPEILTQLRSDLSEEVKQGNMDLIYLPDASDYKVLSSEGLLYGPFIGTIKTYALQGNHNAIESAMIDGNLHNGYAIPLWKKSMYLIGNEDILLNMPETYDQFIEAIKNNPNTFTFSPEDTVGGRILRGFVLHKVSYKDIVKANSKAELKTLLGPVFKELSTLKKQFYMEGERFPTSTKEVDQLFINKKLAFSMSDVMEHIYDAQKLDAYPEGAKPFLFEGFMPYEPEFMVIPFNAGDKSGALLTLNTILSPKLQASLLSQNGPGLIPILNMDLLTDEEKVLITKASVKKTIPKGEGFMRMSIADVPKVKQEMILSLFKEYMQQ